MNTAFKRKSNETPTATTDLGNWLNGKMILSPDDFANPKTGLFLFLKSQIADIP